MSALGYEFLRQALNLSAFEPARPALLKPVTRLQGEETHLAVPRHVAPAVDDPLAHVLFALKHEGTNLQILAEALPKIEPDALLAELRKAPTGTYIRVVAYLWEQFTNTQLEGVPEISGPTAEVFDSEKYFTVSRARDPRWRVSFNGLGSIRYCATVERTRYLEEAIKSNILGRTKSFIESLGAGIMDRALAWAYLHETEDSFAIERESPSEDKARAFIELLHQAHEKRELSEDYLVELQNSVLTNPLDKAVTFRTGQNWLQGPARGAVGVTYLPPPPMMVGELMAELRRFATYAPRSIDPVIAAALISFGFVFIHPFMDGNGRLSRFLFHHALCQSGKLEKGLLLPVSVAMKRNEEAYLATLQQYSASARKRWNVRWIDEGEYEFSFNGNPAVYRFWNATGCVEFGYRMAEQALEVDLRQETEYLARYDYIIKAVTERFDVRSSDLSTLIRCCLDQGGKLSNHRRKQFARRVPEKVFDFIEEATKTSEIFGEEDEENGSARV